MSKPIIGIDLGTTNSAVAAIIDDHPQIIPVHGRHTMPSVVGLGADGKIIVGQAARNQLAAAPDRTIESIKRSMGEHAKVNLGEREFSPEEISAFILRELKLAAEEKFGQTVSQAVITVPAYFNEHQRKATQAAGEIAELEVVRIINEPTAAALAYGADRRDDEKLLVYDLGGGTFDVSVVVVERGIVEVKASHGDTQLGGNDFDELLAAEVLRAFLSEADPEPDLTVRRRLRALIEPAKCRLTDEPDVAFREEYFLGDRHLEHELLRHEYERLIEPLIEKTFASVHRALSDANLAPAEIDKIMLVGGASRTPLIHAMIDARLSIEPNFEIDPDLIVALGAAVQAGIVAGHRGAGILVDITPHGYSTGVIAPDGFGLNCVPLIPRNTPLPASKASLFHTSYDNQEVASIDVFQGEGFLPEDNLQIGQFLIEGLSPVPRGNLVRIEYHLDLNGILSVTAMEKSTGLAKSVTIDTKGEEIIDFEQARRNVAALLDEAPAPDAIDISTASPANSPDDNEHEELLNTAKDLRKRAEALLETGLSEDDAHDIRQALDATRAGLKDRDWPAVEKNNDTLSDLLFYLED